MTFKPRSANLWDALPKLSAHPLCFPWDPSLASARWSQSGGWLRAAHRGFEWLRAALRLYRSASALTRRRYGTLLGDNPKAGYPGRTISSPLFLLSPIALLISAYSARCPAVPSAGHWWDYTQVILIIRPTRNMLVPPYPHLPG